MAKAQFSKTKRQGILFFSVLTLGSAFISGCTKEAPTPAPQENAETTTPPQTRVEAGDQSLHNQSFPLKLENFKTASNGLQYEDLTSGSGDAPKKGDFVTIHFTEWSEKGNKLLTTQGDNHIFQQVQKFQAMAEEGETIRDELMKFESDESFLLHWLPFTQDGSDAVSYLVGCGWGPKGFDSALMGMKPGGKRLIVLPSKLGYGEEGYQGFGFQVKPNESIVYAIELYKVEESPYHRKTCQGT